MFKLEYCNTLQYNHINQNSRFYVRLQPQIARDRDTPDYRQHLSYAVPQSNSTEMNVMAENMFDEIAKRYEAAFLEDPSLHQIINRVLNLLEPNSDILDVGCGTGRPVSYRMAECGHKVIGIDISQEMIAIAKRQVTDNEAEFEKADMTKYAPKKQFDAIFAVFSLFNISYSQTVEMLEKYHQWLKPGGRVIIATIPSDCMFEDKSLYDESGN